MPWLHRYAVVLDGALVGGREEVGNCDLRGSTGESPVRLDTGQEEGEVAKGHMFRVASLGD